jgi:phosphoribosylaminoimidazole carboxylase (NCAIR synthetase)
MIEDIKKSKETYNHFIKECIKQLKTSRYCYVYNKDQLNEILERFGEELIVEENECGYTIKKAAKK